MIHSCIHILWTTRARSIGEVRNVLRARARCKWIGAGGSLHGAPVGGVRHHGIRWIVPDTLRGTSTRSIHHRRAPLDQRRNGRTAGARSTTSACPEGPLTSSQWIRPRAPDLGRDRFRPPFPWSSSEAHLPAQEAASQPQARLPSPHVGSRRAGHHQVAAPQGPSQAVCLIDRVSGRDAFRRFRADGVRTRSGPLTVVVAPPGTAERSSVAFALPRTVGTAVVRNRLRRQLRAAAGSLDQDGLLPPASYLIIVGPAAKGESMTTLRGHLRTAVRRGTSQRAADEG